MAFPLDYPDPYDQLLAMKYNNIFCKSLKINQ